MKKSKTVRVLGLVLGLVLTMGLGLAGAADYCPDNFIFLVDQSGSMYMHFGDPQLKMAVSKKVLLSINEQIPPANYKGANFTAALELFAPVQELVKPGPYDRAAMGKALKSIKDEQEIFGRFTPMGPGIMSLNPVLAKMTGQTAIILVTDGMANMGTDPVAEARELYSRHPDICIHIISVADAKDKKGKEILKAINKMNNCSIMAEGLTLDGDRAALEKFVLDVFCTPKKEEVRRVEKIVLRGIQFDFDKYNIKPAWMPVLDEAARILKSNPNISVVIEGHTDGIGTEQYNQKLSERRANAVYNYLSGKTISKTRMKTVGYGKLRPIATNATDEGRAINRRVELKVVE